MAKILVVDDERVLVKGITFNLKNEGYQVETGYDGEEAVELAREGKFDLIILDRSPRPSRRSARWDPGGRPAHRGPHPPGSQRALRLEGRGERGPYRQGI